MFQSRWKLRRDFRGWLGPKYFHLQWAKALISIGHWTTRNNSDRQLIYKTGIVFQGIIMMEFGETYRWDRPTDGSLDNRDTTQSTD